MREIESSELEKITHFIHQQHGYDFRDYAMSSFKRRIIRMMEMKQLGSEELLLRLKDQSFFANEFLNELTVNVTEMFRDHSFWQVLKNDIFPQLLTAKPSVKIWHAGCSSGEEVLSMAIMLEEMAVLDRVSIAATDLDLKALEKARAAVFQGRSMELNEKNYRKFAGPDEALKKYYKLENGSAWFDKNLLRTTSFTSHDLVTGPVFDTFDLILCRNVMIYFNQDLQNEVLKKFHASLFVKGCLAIGAKESLVWCDISNRFAVVSNDDKVYRKIRE